MPNTRQSGVDKAPIACRTGIDNEADQAPNRAPSRCNPLFGPHSGSAFLTQGRHMHCELCPSVGFTDAELLGRLRQRQIEAHWNAVEGYESVVPVEGSGGVIFGVDNDGEGRDFRE